MFYPFRSPPRQDLDLPCHTGNYPRPGLLSSISLAMSGSRILSPLQTGAGSFAWHPGLAPGGAQQVGTTWCHSPPQSPLQRSTWCPQVESSLCARPGWHNGLWRGRCGSGCSKAQGLLTDPFLLDRTLWRAQNLGEAGRQVGPSSRHSRPAANEHVPGQLLRVPPTHQ